METHISVMLRKLERIFEIFNSTNSTNLTFTKLYLKSTANNSGLGLYNYPISLVIILTTLVSVIHHSHSNRIIIYR